MTEPSRIRLDGTDGVSRLLRPRRLFIAGFTGRDTAAVRAHVEELSALGVPAPDSTPILVELEPTLLSAAETIRVDGEYTSGEVEPVLVVAEGERLLVAGSDHTDRALERVSIALSKRACPKVIGRTAIPLGSLRDWDSVELTSWVEAGEPYQSGHLSDLLSLSDLELFLGRVGVELAEGDVVFLGTVPVHGEIVPSRHFRGLLRDPGTRSESTVTYETLVTEQTGGRQKPEFEFFPVDTVPWTPCRPHLPGLSERILSADENGVATRMLRFDPGVDTSPLGTQVHDFWEEVYILEGEVIDVGLDRVFTAGTYACRPPGMRHGPWKSEKGCTTFEARYPGPA